MKLKMKIAVLSQITLLSVAPEVSLGLKQCPPSNIDFLKACQDYDNEKYGTEAFLNKESCEGAYRHYILSCASANSCDDALSLTLQKNPCTLSTDSEGYVDLTKTVSCAAGIGAADKECRKLNPKEK